MRYSIAFKNLPFEPEKRQVIYVENQYDERINAIIKEKYDWLKYQFKHANLDFVYLPMFFNDEEIKEKVLYYAPYLTSEIMEKVELRSSYLLGYMSHIENKVKILPSFLYAPQKEADEWVFQGQTIDLSEKDDLAINKWFEDSIYDIEEELPIVHRCIRFDKAEESSAMTGTPISSESKPEYSSTPIWDKLKKGALQFGKSMVEEEVSATENPSVAEEDSLDEIRSKEIGDIFEAMEKNIKELLLLGVSVGVLHEFIDKYVTISHLRITDDLRIFLPDYGNKEVKMFALHKALYLTFIYNRKKGIVLQRLEEQHHDLLCFYRKSLNKQELTQKQEESIKKLESSYEEDEESIHSVLSKIKTAFNNAVDKHLARHYYIVGKPGEPYNIANNNVIIDWEEDYE